MRRRTRAAKFSGDRIVREVTRALIAFAAV
jgi:hypothetical protein